MAKRSTRRLIKDNAERCLRELEHLEVYYKTIDDLSQGRNKQWNEALPKVLELHELYKGVVARLRDIV